MSVKKYNFELKKYVEYSLPKGAILYSNIDNLYINCANCGKALNHKDSYTSLTIHNNFGFGYCICQDCYKQEIIEKNKYN